LVFLASRGVQVTQDPLPAKVRDLEEEIYLTSAGKEDYEREKEEETMKSLLNRLETAIQSLSHNLEPSNAAAAPGDIPKPEPRTIAEMLLRSQRWLAFLFHACKCTYDKGECPWYASHCHVARRLWQHARNCQTSTCTFPRCVVTRELLSHYDNCHDSHCTVCGPVREIENRKTRAGEEDQNKQPGDQVDGQVDDLPPEIDLA
jgi:hypothetical protein